MLVDSRLELCNGTALNTGAAGTYLIGNQIDFGNVRDIGNNRPLYLVIQVSTTATSGGSATGQFKLASDASAAVATDGSATDHIISAQFAVAAMTAGTVLAVIALPKEGNVYERFLGLLQITGTAAFTAGAIDAFLTHEPPAWKAYPDAVN